MIKKNLILIIIIIIIIITIIIINVIHRLPGTSFSLHPHEYDASRLGIIPFRLLKIKVIKHGKAAKAIMY